MDRDHYEKLSGEDEDGDNTTDLLHDSVANIPAEISHIMEEVQAKDYQMEQYKQEIAKREIQLQKFTRSNGGHVANPKEEAFTKTIRECFDKCEILQEAKCGLVQRAQILLDRSTKKLDMGINNLMIKGDVPADWEPPASFNMPRTGASTPAAGVAAGLPLQAVSGNIGSTGGMPNVAQMRLNPAASRNSPAASAIAASTPRSSREGSSDPNTRRRVAHASLGSIVPATSSSLRQSSLGPGTPKAGTPVPTASHSRSGSVQPARPSASSQKKGPLSQSANPARKPPPSNSHKKGASGRSHRPSKKSSSDRRRQLARDRTTTPSTNASLSGSDDEGSASPSSAMGATQLDGSGDADENDDETEYCLCHKVSYGDMVGCDNDECQFQWFHYK
jgi:inhibitor of growth protein 3